MIGRVHCTCDYPLYDLPKPFYGRGCGVLNGSLKALIGSPDDVDNGDSNNNSLLLSSNLSGLSKYQSAVDAGLGGQDCSLLYSQCPLSYARAFTSLF